MLKTVTLAVTQKIQSERDFDEAMAFFKAKEFKKAFPLMKQSAEAGNREALLYLGLMLMRRQGVEADWAKSAKLFQMLIDSKHYDGTKISAMLSGNMGMMYGIGGYGLKRNLEQAKALLEAAVAAGDENYSEPLRMMAAKKGSFFKAEVTRPPINWNTD